MAIRDVLRMGHPLLQQTAQPVTEFNTAELQTLLAEMFEIMAEQEGIGLAAPQIGVDQQVMIFGMESSARYPEAEAIAKCVLINPRIEPLSERIEEAWEGCLSLPGMRGWVPRYADILYRGFDQSGDPIEVEAHGFHARVVQHEYDHLVGVLYPQRMRNMSKFGYIEELFGDAQESELTDSGEGDE